MGPRRFAFLLLSFTALIFVINTVLLNQAIFNDEAIAGVEPVGNAGKDAVEALDQQKAELEREWEELRQRKEALQKQEAEVALAQGQELHSGGADAPPPAAAAAHAGVAMPVERQQHTDYKMPLEGQGVEEAHAALQREEAYRAAALGDTGGQGGGDGDAGGQGAPEDEEPASGEAAALSATGPPASPTPTDRDRVAAEEVDTEDEFAATAAVVVPIQVRGHIIGHARSNM